MSEKRPSPSPVASMPWPPPTIREWLRGGGVSTKALIGELREWVEWLEACEALDAAPPVQKGSQP